MQYNLSLLGDGLRRCKGEKENSSWFEIRNENEEVFCFIISRQYLICNREQILSDIRYTDFSFWLKSQATISALFLFLTLILLQIPLRFWQSYFPCSYYFICHPKYYNGRNNFWIPNFIISSMKLKCIGKSTISNISQTILWYDSWWYEIYISYHHIYSTCHIHVATFMTIFPSPFLTIWKVV